MSKRYRSDCWWTFCPIVTASLFVAVIAIFQTDLALAADNKWRSPGPLRINDDVRRIWDSGLYGAETFEPFFWLDNSTLLIAANNGPKPKDMEGMRARQTWLYLWTLGNNPRPHGADPHQASHTYCAAQGQVSYSQGPLSGTRSRWVGPPGQEKEAAPWKAPAAGAPTDGNNFIERVDCEQFSDPSMAEQIYLTDSERRYYLVLGGDLANRVPDETIILMRADNSNKTFMPIYRDEGPRVQYRLFEKLFYVFDDALSDYPNRRHPQLMTPFQMWRENKCWPYWRIAPDTSKVERLCIPYGPWVGEPRPPESSAATIRLVPTKAGLFFGYSRRKGTSGLFRLRNGDVRHIAAGEIKDPVVSPDGCRVAFYYFPDERAPRLFSTDTSSLVVIDVCSAEP